MLTIKGCYDGKVIRLLDAVQAHPGAEVIVTFLDEAAESWIQQLTATPKVASLTEIHRLLSILKAPLSETVSENREERL